MKKTNIVYRVIQQLMDATMNGNETELARRVGHNQPYIHRITNDLNYDPGISKIVPIAQYFGVSLDVICGLEPIPPKYSDGKAMIPTPVMKMVPVIDIEVAANYEENMVKSLIYVGAPIFCSHQSFGIKTEENQYCKYIIVDPNDKPQNKDKILISESNHNLVKILDLDGPRKYLLGVDDIAHRIEFTDRIKIIGTVITTIFLKNKKSN